MRALFAGLGLLLAHAETRDASACDRARTPFESVEAGVASADVVIVGEVVQLTGKVATVEIVSNLKGGGKAGDRVRVRGVTPAADVDRCGGTAIEVGKRYVFLLWSAAGSLGDYHLVDSHAGAVDLTTTAEKRFTDAIASNHPSSAWKVKGNVATQLLLAPDPANKGDVDLIVVLRNVGTKPLLYKARAWPRAKQSKCTLNIVHKATNKQIAATRVPIDDKDIASYFSKHSRAWETKIAPGEAQLVRLQRVTTAKPGWGYKEDLGFVFYPVETAGDHEVTADCANMIGAGTHVTTHAITLALSP